MCAPRVPCTPTALSRSLPVHTACAVPLLHALSAHITCFPFDSAGDLGGPAQPVVAVAAVATTAAIAVATAAEPEPPPAVAAALALALVAAAAAVLALAAAASAATGRQF